MLGVASAGAVAGAGLAMGAGASVVSLPLESNTAGALEDSS
jgi:hypothetical protein